MRSRLVLLAALVSSSAFARGPVSVGVGYAAQVLSDRSFDLVSMNDHLGTFHVAASYELPFEPAALELDLSYFIGGSSAPIHVSYTGDLGLQALEAGAAGRYRLHRFFEPYARLGLGYGWAVLRIGSPERLSQLSGAIQGSALAGFQVPIALKLGRAERFKLVLDLSAGYTLRPEFGFHELSPPVPWKVPADSLPATGVDLGSLSLSGITYRFGAAFRV